MKNVLTKITYMVIGSILTLIGYHFGNIDNNTADAQKDDPIVDEIQCRRFVIVGKDNTPRIILNTHFDYGRIEIVNQEGAERLRLGTKNFDGFEAGYIDVLSEPELLVSSIGSDAYGGFMIIYNRSGSTHRPVVHAASTERGHGIVVTADKDGQVGKAIGGTIGELFWRTIKRGQRVERIGRGVRLPAK